MGSTQRAQLKALPSPALLDDAYEMSCRTSSLLGYLKEFGDLWGSGEIKKTLLQEQQRSAVLAAELETLRKTRKEEKQESDKAQKYLAEVSRQLKESEGALEEARASNSILSEECHQLKEGPLSRERLKGGFSRALWRYIRT